jgi:hypothetical protein
VRITRRIWGLQHIVIGQLLVAVHVGDHADQAAVIGQAFFQNGAGRGLDDGGFGQTVGQQAMGAGPVGGIGLLRLAIGEEHAFAAGHAGQLARQLQQPADQARDEGACADNADQDATGAGTVFAGKRWSAMAMPTGRGAPLVGLRCISRPGPALTSGSRPGPAWAWRHP